MAHITLWYLGLESGYVTSDMIFGFPQKHSIKPMAYGHQTVVNEHGDKPIDLRNLGIRTLEIGTSTYNCKTSGFGIYHSEWTQVCALFALEMMLRHVGSSMIKWQTLDPSI